MRRGRCAADLLRLEIACAEIACAKDRAPLGFYAVKCCIENSITARRCLALFADEMLHTAARQATNVNRTSIVSQLPQFSD